MAKGSYFSDYDEASGSWCVFHTDLRSGFAYASFSTEGEAEANAQERNA